MTNTLVITRGVSEYIWVKFFKTGLLIRDLKLFQRITGKLRMDWLRIFSLQRYLYQRAIKVGELERE
jgi:hypothetical protein